MTNMLKNGMAWLEEKRNSYATDMVAFKRATESVNLLATIGKTEFSIDGNSDAMVTAEAIDFLVLTNDLVLGGVKIEPEQGDKIQTDRATYEVQFLAGEGCWRFSDPFGITRRIHTKLVS